VDLQQAVAAAKRRVAELCAPDLARNVRLESYLYDDHLGVWSLTIGFARPQDKGDAASPEARDYKVVRVSEANKSVLSVADR
jgi:hypothetical protein